MHATDRLQIVGAFVSLVTQNECMEFDQSEKMWHLETFDML